MSIYTCRFWCIYITVCRFLFYFFFIFFLGGGLFLVFWGECNILVRVKDQNDSFKNLTKGSWRRVNTVCTNLLVCNWALIYKFSGLLLSALLLSLLSRKINILPPLVVWQNINYLPTSDFEAKNVLTTNKCHSLAARCLPSVTPNRQHLVGAADGCKIFERDCNSLYPLIFVSRPDYNQSPVCSATKAKLVIHLSGKFHGFLTFPSVNMSTWVGISIIGHFIRQHGIQHSRVLHQVNNRIRTNSS